MAHSISAKKRVRQNLKRRARNRYRKEQLKDNVKEFNGYNLDEILTYEPKGGGGTDFDVNFAYMKESGLTPHRFVMFTDGYPCGSWGDENYVDTLFVIHGNDSIVAPFGITAYYEDAKKK